MLDTVLDGSGAGPWLLYNTYLKSAAFQHFSDVAVVSVFLFNPETFFFFSKDVLYSFFFNQRVRIKSDWTVELAILSWGLFVDKTSSYNRFLQPQFGGMEASEAFFVVEESDRTFRAFSLASQLYEFTC